MKKETITKATHTGIIKIGKFTIPCAVLEDGTRVLTQYGFYEAIGRSGKPASGRGSQFEKVAPFLALQNLKPFVSDELARSTHPIAFQMPTGAKSWGFKAQLLPEVCDIYLKARDAGVLLKSQIKFATVCDLVMRGLAHVGITALVDEATGYQEVRDRLALQVILEKYLLEEYQKTWTKRFPNEFYEHMFRLKGWTFDPGSIKRPGVVGKYTNDLVYERLAPGVLDEIRSRNDEVKKEKGFKVHQHRWLTLDTGIPALDRHLAVIIAFEAVSTNWEQFMRMVRRRFPKRGEQSDLLIDK